MGKESCCIKSCKNTGKNSVFKFFKFSRAMQKIDQRKKWIDVVRKANLDTSDWIPKLSDRICGEHFITNTKSNDPLAPNYIPKIFSEVPLSKVAKFSAAVNRHERFVKRRDTKQKKPYIKQNETKVPGKIDILSDKSSSNDKEFSESKESQIKNDWIENNYESVYIKIEEKLCVDKGCQVEAFLKNCSTEKVFICNRYIYVCADGSSHGEAETQTEIIQCSNISILPNRKMKNQSCGTPHQIFEDKAIETDCDIAGNDKRTFEGINSAKTDQQLLDLAGVSFNNLNFLLKRMNDCDSEKFKLCLRDRLFIFLMKMKTGLTFSALSVLFCVPRSTISRIFFSVLDDLAQATSNLVYWPSKDVVRDTMPACFHPSYSSTRVIIDCTEFRIEAPPNVDDQAFTFSLDKKGYTAKVLIGSTPGGFISFKSKVSGGRKTDCQIIVESNLLDLLEQGDTVLADKSFPQVQQFIDKKDKKVMLVMPPFLHNKQDYTEDETKETYSIASVPIHIERIMQRIRIYQILNKVPHNLMNSLDDIIHVACVLVNLQPLIIKKQEVLHDEDEN